jgi:hypothetical protein
MEPGEGAVLDHGWWIWQPHRRMSEVVLATSGLTGAGWQLCADGTCRMLTGSPGSTIRLAPCATQP